MAEARWRGAAATLAGAVLRKFTKSERSWVATAALVLPVCGSGRRAGQNAFGDP